MFPAESIWNLQLCFTSSILPSLFLRARGMYVRSIQSNDEFKSFLKKGTLKNIANLILAIY